MDFSTYFVFHIQGIDIYVLYVVNRIRERNEVIQFYITVVFVSKSNEVINDYTILKRKFSIMTCWANEPETLPSYGDLKRQ